jgi:S-methylmethionine-dependent homocysteine/selenocysteine methylase
MNKAKTINLKGKEYATVAERIRLFREACPNGLIETTPIFQPDGQILFTARVLKDKANPTSGEATGHSIGKGTADKVLERLETVSVGRALAMLGYLASGEIASGEEMESFYQYRTEKIEQAKLDLLACTTLQDLKRVFLSLGTLMSEPGLIKIKEELKLKLK